MKKLSFIPQLDSFRFLAVFLVIVSHWFESSILNRNPNGLLGVSFFYTLSGFLITANLLYMKRSIDTGEYGTGHALKTFYIRRSLRIFPLYFFIIFLVYIINSSIFRGGFIWFVTYTPNFFMLITHKWPGMLSHFWSLGVEEQFYLVWPFFILLVKTRHLKTLFGIVIAISIISKYFFFRQAADYVPIEYTFPINCFDTFGIGALLAFFYVNDKEKLSGIPWNILFFILTGIGICMFYSSHFSFLFSTVIALGSACIIAQCIKGYRGVPGLVLNNTFLRYLGRISYGIYAYHYFMPWVWHNLTGTIASNDYPLPALYFIHNPFFTRPLITLVMEGLMLLGIASASWYLFEKPLNNLKRYFE